MTACRLSVLLVAASAAACAPRVAPPPFTASRAFHSMASQVHGILEVDVDGDGLPDAVLAVRTADGYRLEVLRQTAGERGPQWKPFCQGQDLPGEDLDALRLVDLGAGPTVFVLVLSENPEELRQAFAVVDLRGGCATVFGDVLELERGEPDTVISPPGLRGGAVVHADGAGLTVIDEPAYLHLQAARGELRVLQGVRARTARFRGGRLQLEERSVPLLGALDTSVRRGELTLVSPPEAGGPLLHLAAGADGHLVVTADRPIALLELRHGCAGADEPFTLATSGSPPYVLGTRPPTDGPVTGAGSGAAADGGRKDLVSLRVQAATVELELGPADAERCLRSLKTYGFATTAESGTPAR